MIPAPPAKQASQVPPPDTTWLIETEADRQAVLEQLDRMLASPVFRGSKRLSGFLRFIVQRTLDNNGAELKERIIGVQVFGRSPDYDTSAEPVVRVSAGDLRKRIAQYYHEPACDGELRIDLPVGSYHPVFHLPPSALTASSLSALIPPAELPGSGSPDESAVAMAAEPPAPVPMSRWRSNRFRVSAAALVIMLGGTVVAAMTRLPGSAYQQFWEPVIADSGPVLIYAGARQSDDHIVFEDALALVNLSGDLRSRNKPYRILNASDLTPETLKQGPSLLIGGFTNKLARRLTEQLRFTFASEGDADSAGIAYIQDRQNLGNKAWSVRMGPALAADADFTDYAIVSRVVDPVTDRIAVVSAGIRKYGTLAAAEFLSRPDELDSLSQKAPRDWRKTNMQAVLAIDVRGGKAGRPRVVASYFW